MRGKPSIKKSFSVYQKIINKSWLTVKTHRWIWPIAALAGVINTGAIFNKIVNNFWQIQPADKISAGVLEKVFIIYPWVKNYIVSTLTLGSTRIIFTFTVVLIILTVLIIIFLVAQQIVLVHTDHQSREKKSTWKIVKKDLEHIHFWRLFSVNALTYLAVTLLSLLSSLLLVVLLGNDGVMNTFVYIALYAVLLPIGFLINALGVFTLITIVKTKKGINKAFLRAWKVIKTHWLVSFEMAIILYFINLIAIIILITLLAFLVILLTLFGGIIINLGILWLLGLSMVGGITLIVLCVISLFGMITTFNYSIWSHLFEEIKKKRMYPVAEPVFRFFK